MEDLFSYQIIDLIPYTQEVYARLLERVGEAYWPWHLAAMILGTSCVFLLARQWMRLAMIGIALSWLIVGYAFFENFYGELNWAGSYFAYAFYTQALLLLVCVVSASRFTTFQPTRKNHPFTRLIAFSFMLFALLIMPLLVAFSDRSWLGAQTFALYPLPTVIFTIGAVLLALRGILRLLVSCLPSTWLIYSALEQWALSGGLSLIQSGVLVVLFMSMLCAFRKLCLLGLNSKR